MNKDSKIDYTKIGTNPASIIMGMKGELDKIDDPAVLKDKLVEIFMTGGEKSKKFALSASKMDTLNELKYLMYNFLLGAMGLSKKRVGLESLMKSVDVLIEGGAEVCDIASFSIEEDVLINIDGCEMLLESGDQLSIV